MQCLIFVSSMVSMSSIIWTIFRGWRPLTTLIVQWQQDVSQGVSRGCSCSVPIYPPAGMLSDFSGRALVGLSLDGPAPHCILR